MKSDRFLVLILIGIVLLAGLAVVVFFIRQGSLTYTSDATPRGVVQNYLVAVSQDNYDLAYQYLAHGPNMPAPDRFQQYLMNFNTNASDISVQIGDTNLFENQASVGLIFIQPGSGPFGATYRQTQLASLELQNGAWKITQMPYPFWDYAWSQAAPAAKPPLTTPAIP